MKKIITVCLFVIMVVFSVVPAFAVDSASVSNKGSISPMFVGISTMSASIDIDYLGCATCAGSVSLSNNSYSVNFTVALQRYNGSGWTTIKTWSDTGYGYDGTIIEGYYYVPSSGTYRTASTAKVYNSSGSLIETQTIYSGTKTY